MGKKSGSGISENARRTIEDALHDLAQAVSALTGAPRLRVLLPRPREFEICDGVCWPKIEDNGEADFLAVYIISTFPLRATYKVDWARQISEIVVGRCQTPHELITALYNIRAATAWCDARTAGRLRQAQEVLRQRRSK